jgi:hypothetical protein
MRFLRFTALLGFASLVAAARGAEFNYWPVWVGHGGAGGLAGVDAWSGAGPLLFGKKLKPGAPPEDGTVRAGGFRPFYVQKQNADGRVVKSWVVYPLFRYRAWQDGYQWSIFSLINRQVDVAARPDDAPTRKGEARSGFDLWPVYFSRQTDSPETSYRALFPIYGSIPNRFGQDRWTWTLFPLYGRFEKNGVTTLTTPWPFVKTLSGEGNRGFELWPLFGRREKQGAYREQFYLWPLGFKNERKLWEPQPEVKLGVLPFYYRETSADVRSESYLFLFFGYTDRVAPYRYQEKRYFWPLFVRGRGDDRHIDRWGPFYTHSIVKGAEKTWIAWPLWRELSWTDGPLTHTKRQFLYFLYNSSEQRSAHNGSLPRAHKTHLWPLVSVWDNGAGRRQVQALSPFEVFFPDNEPVRLSYSPLFAVYRYDRTATGVRHSVLWDLVTYRRETDTREFHLGPLFSADSSAGAKRYALGAGLLGLRRDGATDRWRFFVFDFSRRKDSDAARVVQP